MQLFYYLQLIDLIRYSLCLKEKTTKQRRQKKINVGKKIIIPVRKLNFCTMRDFRSHDEDYDINVHCGKKKKI